MTSILFVRSVVAASVDRQAFDAWYGQELSMIAYKAFAPIKFWRCWSDTDPLVHYAFYEFANVDRIHEVTESAEFAELVSDYTNTWGDYVSRSRDIMTVVHQYP